MTTKDRISVLIEQMRKAEQKVVNLKSEVVKLRTQLFYEKNNLIPGEPFYVNGIKYAYAAVEGSFSGFAKVYPYTQSGKVSVNGRYIYDESNVLITQNKQ